MPLESLIIQKLVFGHEMVSGRLFGSTESAVDHELPFQVRTFPLLSTALQKLVLGQDTDAKPSPFGSMESGADQLEPFQVRTLPLLSTMAQKLLEAHDRPEMPLPFGSFTDATDNHDFPFHEKTGPL